MAIADKHSSQKSWLIERAVKDLVEQNEGRVSRQEVLQRVSDVDPALVSSQLSRIVRRGDLIRLARGLYSLPGQELRSAADVGLDRDAQRLAAALRDESAWALVSGLDVLAPFMNQIPEGYPFLVVAEPGHGMLVEEAAARLDLHVFLNPSRAELALIAGLGRGAVIVRERSLIDHPEPEEVDYKRRPEDAWADLANEANRGYPVSESELAAILRNMVGSDVSWSRLARSAQRRGMPAFMAPEFDPPIRVKPKKRSWVELARELESVG